MGQIPDSSPVYLKCIWTTENIWTCTSHLQTADMNDNTVHSQTFPLFHYLRKILLKCRCISLFILGTIGIIVIIRKPECIYIHLILPLFRPSVLPGLPNFPQHLLLCCQKYFQVKSKSVIQPEKVYLFLTY